MSLRGLVVRRWRDRPGRALATATAVAVAVGAVVATWVAADASRAGYRRLVESVDGVPSVDVSARDGGRFAAATVPRLVDVPDVRAVVPLFYRPTLLRVGERRVREIAVGVDADALAAAGLLTMLQGEPCRGADEVVLDATLAASLKLTVGDEILFFARRRVARLRITGLASAESLRWFAEGAGVVVDIRTLGAMSLASGLVDRVRIVARNDVGRASIRDAIARRLPDGLVAELPVGRASLAEDVLHAADLGLDFVTGLTVAMAWFIVGNALLMNVTERRRSLALVRLLGATGSQVRALVIGEAAVLGAVGAVVGAAAGLAAARPITAGIARTLQAPAAGLPPDSAVLPAAVLGGVAIAIAAAWWPAREAIAIDPLDGLAAAPPAPRPGVPRGLVATVGLAAGAAAVVQTLVVAEALPARAAVPAGIALVLSFVAATPVVLPPLVRLLGRLVPARWRTEGTLAVEALLRQPVRTALTTGVLVVAVSNGIGLGHAIRDNVDDVRSWYDRMLQADWLLAHAGVLSAAGDASQADPRGAEAAVATLAGVRAVEGLGVAIGHCPSAPSTLPRRTSARHWPAGRWSPARRSRAGTASGRVIR